MWPAARTALRSHFLSRPMAHWQVVFAGTDACVSPVLHLGEVHNGAAHTATREVMRVAPPSAAAARARAKAGAGGGSMAIPGMEAEAQVPEPEKAGGANGVEGTDGAGSSGDSGGDGGSDCGASVEYEPAPAPRLSRTPATQRSRAIPRSGQHTREVLLAVGCSASEVDALMAAAAEEDR